MSRPISAYSQNVKFGPVFPDFDEGEGSYFHTLYIQHLCSQVIILTRKAPEDTATFLLPPWMQHVWVVFYSAAPKRANFILRIPTFSGLLAGTSHVYWPQAQFSVPKRPSPAGLICGRLWWPGWPAGVLRRRLFKWRRGMACANAGLRFCGRAGLICGPLRNTGPVEVSWLT